MAPQRVEVVEAEVVEEARSFLSQVEELKKVPHNPRILHTPGNHHSLDSVVWIFQNGVRKTSVPGD